MKGAARAMPKHYKEGRFIEMTEPFIIAANPPNGLGNELVIMPNIKKHIEAFVCLGHGIIIFYGGFGTAEEFPVSVGHHDKFGKRQSDAAAGAYQTGGERRLFPRAGRLYRQHARPPQASRYYSIIIDDAAEVACRMKKVMPKVQENLRRNGDAYGFNLSLRIAHDLQHPLEPSHKNMPTFTFNSRLNAWWPRCAVPSPASSPAT